VKEEEAFEAHTEKRNISSSEGKPLKSSWIRGGGRGRGEEEEEEEGNDVLLDTMVGE
jgi:hypothetical protein